MTAIVIGFIIGTCVGVIIAAVLVRLAVSVPSSDFRGYEGRSGHEL